MTFEFHGSAATKGGDGKSCLFASRENAPQYEYSFSPPGDAPQSPTLPSQAWQPTTTPRQPLKPRAFPLVPKQKNYTMARELTTLIPQDGQPLPDMVEWLDSLPDPHRREDPFEKIDASIERKVSNIVPNLGTAQGSDGKSPRYPRNYSRRKRCLPSRVILVGCLRSLRKKRPRYI